MLFLRDATRCLMSSRRALSSSAEVHLGEEGGSRYAVDGTVVGAEKEGCWEDGGRTCTRLMWILLEQWSWLYAVLTSSCALQ